MNTTPTNSESPAELDRLFSDYFKAQLKKPWPNAPIPPVAGAPAATEPSELVAARTASAPRNTPARPASAKGRDNTARARFTLAVSVALMLGTCWYLSNGFDPVGRPGGAPSQNGGPGLLKNGEAAPPPVVNPLDTIKENKAKGNTGGGFDMGKIE
jgi:hypothetical protein